MNKTLKIAIPIIVVVLIIISIYVVDRGYSIYESICDNTKTINNKMIEKLTKTKSINVKEWMSNNSLTTIYDEKIIEEIISIFSSGTKVCGVTTSEGAHYSFEMIDSDGNRIDSVDFFFAGRIQFKSNRTNYFADAYSLKKILEQALGSKFYNIIDETESCDEALELIYEDDDYQYYFPCMQSDTVFIKFTTEQIKMTLKEAIEGNYIEFEEIYEKYHTNFSFYKKAKR